MTSLIGSRNSRIEVRTSLEGIVMNPQEIAEQERLEANARSKKPKSPAKPEPVIIPQTTSPIITNPSQTNLPYWTIPNVIYRGVSGNVDVQKTLLENGTSKDQDSWASYSEKERTKGNFYTPDYPLLYRTLEQAFNLKDEKAYKNQIEEMRTTLKGLARAKWLMTLTRIKYAPKGKDTIIHNFGLKDKYSLQEEFMGADGELPAGSPVNVYQNLLGTQSNIGRIKSVFDWFNDTNRSYIWRVNSKPDSVEDRVARFNACSDRAVLDCYGDPSVSYSSLGVRFVRA